MSRPPRNLAFTSLEQSLSIAILLSLCLLIKAPVVLAKDEPASDLQLGKPVERSITAEQTHSYALTLASGQYARVVIDQRGVDVVIVLHGPDGATIVQVDSPNFNYGLEPLSIVAEAAGTYRLDVKTQEREKSTGRYEVKLAELRIATQADRSRVSAQKLSAEAKALRDVGTGKSFQQAIEKYQTALSIWRALGDKMLEAYTLHEVGLIYGDTSQYQRAIDSYAQASSLYQALQIRRGEASILSNMGWLFGELGDNEKSLEMYDRVADLYRSIGDLEPVLLSNIGSSYASLGQYQRALDFHLRVLEMRRAIRDLAGQAITFSNIGNCYDHLGDKEKALDFYHQAIALMPVLNKKYYTAKTLNNIGIVYRTLGEHEKARNYFDQALQIRRTIGDAKGVATTLFQLAGLERDRGNLVEARVLIETALAGVENQRAKIASQQLRATYLASVQLYREFYVDLLMRLHRQNPSENLVHAAFNASERGRARSLLELLREAGTEIRQGVDPLLLERERSLEKLIANKAADQMRLLGGQHTQDEATAAATELTVLTNDYEQVQARIRATSPQYAALTQPTPLKLEEVQQQVLDAGTLLLEYSLGEEKSFLWAITPDTIKSYELPKREVIEPLARRVYELLTVRDANVSSETLAQRRRRLESANAEYPKAAANLSQVLLGPVAAELKNKRLLIVSEGVLQFVPFAGLPDPAAADARALIVDHEIVTAPSASVVALLRQENANRKPATRTLAVVADPVFSTDDPRVKAPMLGQVARRTAGAHALRSTSELDLGNIRRLRFSRQEADEILRFAPDDRKLEAVDFEANRALATSGELGEYRIVHFATHGLINNKHPELSGIVLSLVDEKGRPLNGFLRLYDLYNLKLSAELVVLSACQTALGKEVSGEGLVGLTRGFMYAGAPRVIASLWQIDDRAAAEFMKRFYQGLLGEKLPAAAALRAAQVSMQNDKRWHAPQYWAAFTLQGEWR
jgi:CHAT domain-containing protein/Tfp pilus assembly protein PilF